MSAVNHPPHYTAHPSGIEAVEVCEHLSFNMGNALKYLWRAGKKGDAVEDLQKAEWYLEREAGRLRANGREEFALTRRWIPKAAKAAQYDRGVLGDVIRALLAFYDTDISRERAIEDALARVQNAVVEAATKETAHEEDR